MQVSRRTAAVATLILIPIVVVVSLLVYRFVYLGTPLLDEWYCSDGDAPFGLGGGGSACAPEGSELPAGATWDPLGNRPFSCDSRRGWTVIRRGDVEGGDVEDCLRDGLELPAGWSD